MNGSIDIVCLDSKSEPREISGPMTPSLSQRDRIEYWIYKRLAHLSVFYPSFHHWYWKKVVPGAYCGSRRLFAFKEDDKFGVVIAKRTDRERKLCTVWVDKNLSGRGIATQLVNGAVAWLECDKPLITVSEERLAELRPLLTHFNFVLHDIKESYYRDGRYEYVFNGRISSSPTLGQPAQWQRSRPLDLLTLGDNRSQVARLAPQLGATQVLEGLGAC